MVSDIKVDTGSVSMAVGSRNVFSAFERFLVAKNISIQFHKEIDRWLSKYFFKDKRNK